jgi:hypothetical protein
MARLPRDQKASRKGVRDAKIAFCRMAGEVGLNLGAAEEQNRGAGRVNFVARKKAGIRMATSRPGPRDARGRRDKCGRPCERRRKGRNELRPYIGRFEERAVRAEESKAKRDFSHPQADAFAGAKAKEKNRPAPFEMTVWWRM